MTDNNRFHEIVADARKAADMLTDILRFLDDLADDVRPSLRLKVGYGDGIALWVHSPSDQPLRNSVWHRTVLRLSNIYGPPIITRSEKSVTGEFHTPFGIGVEVHTVHIQHKPDPVETTLEAVLA